MTEIVTIEAWSIKNLNGSWLRVGSYRCTCWVLDSLGDAEVNKAGLETTVFILWIFDA